MDGKFPKVGKARKAQREKIERLMVQLAGWKAGFGVDESMADNSYDREAFNCAVQSLADARRALRDFLNNPATRVD